MRQLRLTPLLREGWGLPVASAQRAGCTFSTQQDQRAQTRVAEHGWRLAAIIAQRLLGDINHVWHSGDRSLPAAESCLRVKQQGCYKGLDTAQGCLLLELALPEKCVSQQAAVRNFVMSGLAGCTIVSIAPKTQPSACQNRHLLLNTAQDLLRSGQSP